MTISRKLSVAAVFLLACGVFVALAMRRPAPMLTLTLRGLETNNQGGVTAKILVSNTSPSHVVVSAVASVADPGAISTADLLSSQAEVLNVSLPNSGPRQVVAYASRVYHISASLLEAARFHFDRYVRRDPHVYTLDIPE